MHLAGASKKFIWQVDKNIVMSNKQNKIKTVDNFSDENLTMFIYYFVREISWLVKNKQRHLTYIFLIIKKYINPLLNKSDIHWIIRQRLVYIFSIT